MQWFGLQQSGNQLLKVAVKKSNNRNCQLFNLEFPMRN
ncbi:hypothetical protein SMA679_1905 [Streptococcus macedonicus]|nr:hypothetical protein SMA679_1905 [Streptococcus macedonicus]